MRVNYKLIFFVMMLLGFLSVLRGIEAGYEISHEPPVFDDPVKKPEPEYVGATEIFNQMAKTTPWIYGFIDRHKTKKENLKHIIPDILSSGDNDPDYIALRAERETEFKKAYPNGKYSSIKDIGEYDENDNLVIQ